MIYSFEPIIDEQCKVLILGTMPGIQSLQKQQYYGNDQNSFWRIVFSLFNENLNENYDKRKEFLLKHHIALWDVLQSCDRVGSADADIRNPVANDFNSLFTKYTSIERVYFNGEPAWRLFNRYVRRNVNTGGLKFHVLPSTSPANTAKYEDKLRYWKLIQYQLQGIDKCDINRVKAYIERDMGHSHQVCIDFSARTAVYKSTEERGDSTVKEKERLLDENGLMDFIHGLFESRVFSWNEPCQSEPHVKDKIRWSVDITAGDREFARYGEGYFPKKWKIFCQAVEQLVGESFE